MTTLYESELQAAEDAFVRVLIDSGVPRELWPSYARLAAERIACMVADQIVGEEYKRQMDADFAKQEGRESC